MAAYGRTALPSWQPFSESSDEVTDLLQTIGTDGMTIEQLPMHYVILLHELANENLAKLDEMFGLIKFAEVMRNLRASRQSALSDSDKMVAIEAMCSAFRGNKPVPRRAIRFDVTTRRLKISADQSIRFRFWRDQLQKAQSPAESIAYAVS